MRTALAAAVLTAFLGLCIGCGGDSKEGKGPGGHTPEQTRTAAQRAAECMQRIDSLKQIGLAMHKYHDAYKSFPARSLCGKEGKPLLSWRVAILPFLQEQDLYEQFHKNEPWDSAHNRKLLDRMPDVYKTPGIKDPRRTCVLLCTGEGTPFGGERGPKLSSIGRDGTARTILCVEAVSIKHVFWTEPEDLPFNEVDPVGSLGVLFPDDFFLALFFDGSVRRLRGSIEPETLRRLVHHADGLPIDPEIFK